ncbi:DUF397 domain-containing protein [Actinomadura atramentaria]|uniref:DUF397 domain-containing protein n=1 Tax=Actinomadura atramentaria TaxID=1990 RepID=UPI000475BC47|nr:DUF397 domain-containing protein [Actinomadura atramentaria]
MSESQYVRAQWRKSSRSNQGGACVELAALAGEIGFRDSKNPAGPVLVFGRGAVTDLAARIRAGLHEL